MSLRSQLGVLRNQMLSSLYTRPASTSQQGPMVSFSFDDFPRTAFSAGGSILKSFGVHGTYYVSVGLMNTTNELGDQFTQDDIESLLVDGHEIGSHTFSHTSCRSAPSDVFENDVTKGRNTILDLIGQDAANFAYPYGHVSIGSKRRIGPQMASSRGIGGGINGPVADLNLLRANSLYGDLDQCDKAETLLLENAKRQGWLIFYTHDVRWNPSPFGCTPAHLDRVVSFAEKIGCNIVSVKEAMSMMRLPSIDPIYSGFRTPGST
jgi:peptidoglycan/xylan/chitin deacetylase (PgdA/CDA1 family)